MSNPPRARKIQNLASQLAQFVIINAQGDPAIALSAICEVAAELMKCGGPTAVLPLKASFLQHLDRFLKIPNSLLVAEQPTTPKIILPGN